MIFWPNMLTDDFRHKIENDVRSNVSKKFFAIYGVDTVDNKGRDRKRTALDWRVKALNEKLDKEVLAYVIADIKGEIQNSMGGDSCFLPALASA